MPAHTLNILEKHRQHISLIASSADFTVSQGEAVDAAEALNNPNISLYCFDRAAKRAIFTELPDGVNLTTVPFVYLEQYTQAQRLVEMDYETFIQAARALPPVNNLIMVYSAGRSGSTLLSHILNQLDEVVSLSEPDVTMEFLHMRAEGSTSEAELHALLDSSVRALFKPKPGKQAAIFALKPRSECLLTMDLFQSTFPSVKNLFMFRDAIGFVSSFTRVFRSDGFPEVIPTAMLLQILNGANRQNWQPSLAYLQPGSETVSIVQAMTLWWMGIMDWYLARYAQGIPMLAIHYTDLNGERDATLKAIFDYCGFHRDQFEKALHAFDYDSQAGTILGRENPNEGNTLRLSDAELAEMRRILAQHPTIQTPSYTLPGMLKLP